MPALPFPFYKNSFSPPPPLPGETFTPAALADAAVWALCAEAALPAKPGLVGPDSPGAHTDMDYALMLRSAHALNPFFIRMAAAAQDKTLPPAALRQALGHIGRRAEEAMLRATGGVNTHRGAIWALGLLVAAAAQNKPPHTAAAIAAAAGRLARQPDSHMPKKPTHGTAVQKKHGIAGARGQAQAGFPAVLHAALPTLVRGEVQGLPPHAARLNALLALMATLPDTCIVHRGGLEALAALQQAAAATLFAGDAATQHGKAPLADLQALCLQRNLSPGGSADLLSAALFLQALTTPQQR